MRKKTTLEEGVIVKKDDAVQTPLAKLPKSQQAIVKKILSEINLESSQDILQYGISAQTEISSFTDSILSTVRAKDTEVIGETLTDLMSKVQDIDVNNLGKGNLLANLPFVGQLFSSGRKFIAKYEKLSTQVEKITSELDSAKIHLFKDMTLLDKLHEKNLNYLKQIELYIIAGNIKLEQMNQRLLPELKAKADTDGTPTSAQQYNDTKNLVLNFERKLHDLKLTRMIALQMAPQIRIVQGNDQALAEKIQGAVLHTIPLWKSQIVLAVTGLKQKKALELYRNITNTTNELLTKNSEMLKENATGIAKEVERGVVDIGTLKEAHTNLLSTIQDMVQIQEDGRKARVAVEVELQKIEGEMKTKLKALNNPNDGMRYLPR